MSVEEARFGEQWRCPQAVFAVASGDDREIALGQEGMQSAVESGRCEQGGGSGRSSAHSGAILDGQFAIVEACGHLYVFLLFRN